MQTVWQDLRYAIRMLVKSPGFTLVAVLTLALGIGANTAIFSVVNGILLRSLPYPEADRLMFLSEQSEQIPDMSISMANFNDWRAQNKVFESMVAYQNEDVVWTGKKESERLRLRRITDGFTPTLRVQPILGRALAPEDDKVGAARVVLLGEGFWERQYGRDAGVVGQEMILDGEPYTIIGVLPSRLHGSLRHVDVFSCLWCLEDKQGGEANRGNHPGIYAYGRLKPGVMPEQASAEMKSIAARIDELHPQTNGKDTIAVRPLLDAIVEDIRPSLLVLMAAVGFVLLIACANIANLLLTRATERHRELAVRLALGAGRGRLIRQMLTESVVLSLLGGGLGLFLAVWVTIALVHSTPAGIPRLDEVSVNTPVLLFTLGLSVFTGLFFGIFPALQASQADISDALKDGGRTGTSGRKHRRFRDILVIAEVSVALVLLVGAGLMGKSLYEVIRADAGIITDHVLTASMALPEIKYKEPAARRAYVNELMRKVQSLPGVEAAGVKTPLLGGWQSSYMVNGRPQPAPDHLPSTDVGRVTPDAMRAMGMRLVRGRFFTDFDNENGAHVCIVDETFVKVNFANENPIGKQVTLNGPPAAGQKSDWLTIVGVVGHVKNYGVDQPSRVETYVPFLQNTAEVGTIVVRAAGDPASLAGAIRSSVRSIDPDMPLYNVGPLKELISENTASRRLAVILISSFAVLALTLAAVGVYGVMAYSVTQRNHEIGVRMALGAAPGDVQGMIIRQGLRVALIGIFAGLLSSLALSRLIASLLFRVNAFDKGTFLTGAALLSIIVMFSAWFPARRASRVDPMIALRYE